MPADRSSRKGRQSEYSYRRQELHYDGDGSRDDFRSCARSSSSQSDSWWWSRDQERESSSPASTPTDGRLTLSTGDVTECEGCSLRDQVRGSSGDSGPSNVGIENYLKLLYDNIRRRGRLSLTLQRPEVVADKRRRKYHWGEDCARQFDMSQHYIFDMLRYMYERFDTVTCYSYGLIDLGMIIYYLSPYTLALDDPTEGSGTSTVGGPRFHARVHMEGRFGIVVGKYANSIKVAQMYTFSKRGLQSKPEKVWHEYVGLRAADHSDFYNPSPNKPLEVANSVCDMDLLTSVHLVTDRVTLSQQILFAGAITFHSRKRLRIMIRKLEKQGD